jgi:hypothetical protein
MFGKQLQKDLRQAVFLMSAAICAIGMLQWVRILIYKNKYYEYNFQFSSF